jgi:transposase
MTYSTDLRKQVVEFVTNGGTKAKVSRQYQVSIWCVNDWCKRDDLTSQPQNGRKRKLDRSALSRHIQKYSDALLRERAQHFGVHTNAIWYASRKMKLTRKKVRTSLKYYLLFPISYFLFPIGGSNLPIVRFSSVNVLRATR